MTPRQNTAAFRSNNLGEETLEGIHSGLPRDFFQRTGFLELKNFLHPDVCIILLERLTQLRTHQAAVNQSYHTDIQVPGSFAVYAEFDCILNVYRKALARLVGELDLVCMNSYARIYSKGALLVPHHDRASFNFTASVCIKSPTTEWPLGLIDREGKTHFISQSLGDLLIFDASLIHWREGSFTGEEYPQIFLHYAKVDSDSGRNNPFDGRPALGPLRSHFLPRFQVPICPLRKAARYIRRNLKRFTGA